MKRMGWMLAAVAGAGLLAGCEQLKELTGGEKSPAAATVAGEKITEAQLDIELKGASNPKDPALRRAAVERIINRKLLAQAAREEKIDKAPEAVVMRQIAAETFDAGLVERDVISKTAEPTKADIDAYIAANPTMFGQRTVYLVDQIQITGTPPQNIAALLQPAETITAVEGVLKANNVPYKRGVTQADSLRIQPNLAKQIAVLKPGQPFALPASGALTINSVRASQVQALNGLAAEEVARQAIRTERRGKALRERLEGLKAAKKDKITYGAGYEPPPPKTGG